ncbi:MAG: 7-carboxy-7-deazaguanine synthase QueE [Planctomycetota bacterium]|nr:MAG: 7-carboxy-7-deazaguanine synthase QueE [Planctomycetota bacterium]
MSVEVQLEEIFLSLQGEGAEAGRPQFFLRLAGCPLRCRYCDTPASWRPRPEFRLVLGAEEEARPNPVPAAELLPLLERVGRAHGVAPDGLTLAVTGGEPLEQADFLRAWLPSWPGPRLLETAGIRPERLAAVLPVVDLVSLDWKLPSTLRPAAAEPESEACLAAVVAAGVRYWLKIVLTADIGPAELAAALARIERLAPAAPVFLQPATPVAGGPPPPPAERLLAWLLDHRHRRLDLRVLPQIHPALGLR